MYMMELEVKDSYMDQMFLILYDNLDIQELIYINQPLIIESYFNFSKYNCSKIYEMLQNHFHQLFQLPLQ